MSDYYSKCLHCSQYQVIDRRNLCRMCYRKVEVRALYPISSMQRFGVGIGCFPGKAPQPTRALPGSPDKVEVLCKRVEAGEYLFHPEDATHEE